MNKESKVLVLWGKSNSGKTDTLVQLINLLIENDCIFMEESKHFGTSADKWCIIQFMGKKIAITTRGDDWNCLNADFEEINKYKIDIDIYICATHEKGKTVDFVKSKFEKENIYWIAKSRLSLGNEKRLNYGYYYTENKNQAYGILSLLKKL